MFSASGSQAVSAGKSGLMDMLAGGHVDEATFRQAIELLRAEDWEALRLLLAGQYYNWQKQRVCDAVNSSRE